MTIKQILITNIKPYENNPRNNENAIDKVAESIKEFGFQNPIIIDENNVIICGHTRYQAGLKLGLKEVPVIVANLTEEQTKAYRLADNKTGEFATWNTDKLEQELSELLNIDMSLFGFDELEQVEIEEDNFNIEEEIEENEEPISQLGNLFKLGNHYLLCGDSTKQEDVLKLMQNKRANLFLTDPPYNVAYGERGQQYEELGGFGCGMETRVILNDNMEDSEFLTFLTNAFKCANEVMKEGATFYIWHSDSEGYNFRGACHDIGWKVRQCLIWVKNSITLGRQDYQWKHEPCLYGWKEGASHSWYNGRSETTILNFDKPLKNDLHPTMKPLELFSYLVQNSTKKNDIVLDLFGGSGTSIIVCEQLDRQCFSMELDPKYCDAIIKRWETLTGQQAEIVN